VFIRVGTHVCSLCCVSECDETWLVGHNMFACDTLVLYTQCAKYGVDMESALADGKVTGIVDTLSIARKTASLAHLAAKDLASVYKFVCGKDLTGAHDALADAKATLEVMNSAIFRTIMRDPVSMLGRSTQAHLSHVKALHSRDAEQLHNSDADDDVNHDASVYSSSSDGDEEGDSSWSQHVFDGPALSASEQSAWQPAIPVPCSPRMRSV
jgi:hypothetical protein